MPSCRIAHWMLLSLLLAVSPSLAAEPDAAKGDWPWWRGPLRNNHAVGQKPPTEWSESKNVVWKVAVPGRGHSSPTIAGDRIFLATADERTEEQSVLACDRATGRQVWSTKISEGGLPKTHRKNTHASCTTACDGERVFVAFHHHERVTIAALDVDGKRVWQRDAGDFDPRIYEYGYAPSPVLHGENVIISADYEQGGWIKAFDRATGKPAWTIDRPRKLSFSSPIVANVAGRDQLLISGCELVASFDPRTGRELWSVEGTTMATCGTMVWEGDVVFASGGYPRAQTIAVKADGSGDILWTNRQKCYEQSMLVHDGHLYAVNDQGIAFCWEAESGREMWRERLEGPVSSSPVFANGNIYATNEAGRTWVFAADPSAYREVSVNQLGRSGFATPAFCDDRIYVRTATTIEGRRREFLYCLGE